MIVSFASRIPERGSVIPRSTPASSRYRALRCAAGLGLLASGFCFSAPQNAQAQTLGSPSVFKFSSSTSINSGTQSYVVPAGVSLLQVEVWGAGGGSSSMGGGSTGGGGGYAGGNLIVTPGQTLSLLVGGGGQSGSPNFGGGPGIDYGGSRSAIDMLVGGVMTEVITAGAGGGAGIGPSPFVTGTGNGGDGGGTVGGDAPVGGTSGGGGGTQTAGGRSGGNGATAGSQFQGGTGAPTGSGFSSGPGGGGGGGGYYGGGGGSGGRGGGGGSSYLSSLIQSGTGVTMSGNNGSAGNSSSSDYLTYAGTYANFVPPVASGGYSDGVGMGGGGMIIIRTITSTAAPEPSSLSLLGGLGLSALPVIAGLRRRRRRIGS